MLKIYNSGYKPTSFVYETDLSCLI